MSRREAREARQRARGEVPGDFARATRRARRRRRGISWRAVPLWRILAVVGGFTLLLVVGTYTFLPPLLGFAFGQNLREPLGLEEAPDVDLGSEPPPEMLLGRFAWAQITMGEPNFGGVRPQKVTIDLEPFDVDVSRSVRSGSFRSREPLSGTISIVLSERNLTRIADAETGDMPIEGVDVSESGATVRLGADVVGIEVPLSIEGDFRLDGQDLVFEPEEVAAFGVRLPEKVSRELLAGTEFAYPLDDLPYGIEIEDAEAKEARLVLSGRIQSLPLGGPAG